MNKWWFIFLSISGYASAQSKSMLIHRMLQKYYQQDALNGCVLVASHHTILYKHGFGKANFEWNIDNAVDTKFEIASISKLFTAVIVLKLIEDHKLSLEGKITDYIPDYPKDNGDKISIDQLLLHRSGLTDSRFIQGFETTEGMESKTHHDHIDYFKDRPLLFEPGSRWSYSNFGYNLLAYIAEKISGKPFHQLLNEMIYAKANMKHSTSLEDPLLVSNLASGYSIRFAEIQKGWYHDPSFTFGIGSVITTVEDYYKFWEALNEGKILNLHSVQLLMTPKTSTDTGESFGYGLYFDTFKIKHDSIKIIRTAGNHYGIHTLMYSIPDDHSLILIFLNTKNAIVNISTPIMFEMADNITKLLHDAPITMPRDSYAHIFYKDEERRGLAWALHHYLSLQKSKSCRENFTYLNRLGYYYLDHNKLEEAIEVFKLNIANYPQNGDGYDSLGEAYWRSGNKELAILNYTKAVSLDPSNDNAKQMLDKLKL